MGRNRNELSKNSKWYISKHRYLELKHFCLQYPEWKREYNKIQNLPPSKSVVHPNSKSLDGYFIEKIALRKVVLKELMEMVEHTANNSDDYLGLFIFQSVTTGMSYDILRMNGMACCKDMFYDRYHKFFWLLDKARN